MSIRWSFGIPVEDDFSRKSGIHHFKSLLELIDGETVSDHRGNIETTLEHAAHFIPGFEHLPPVNALKGLNP